MTPSYWGIVEAIVSKRGRTPKEYPFFEGLWKALDESRGLIFLKAPTGAGKTEACLSPFLYDLISGERRWHSMIYVLPTRSLVHNMFKRFCKALRACREDFYEPKHVIIDYDYGGFLPFKPFIEGDITVTTYDTLMYTFYGFRSYGHHLFLSIGKVAGSLVVLDEAQLLQDNNWYALSLLPYHIANLLVAGATVLVMSATLPRILIEETEHSVRICKVPPSYEVIEADPKKHDISRGELTVSLRDGSLTSSLSDVVERCEKPVLLIFNTVERAVNAYKWLKEEGHSNVVLLHSRLIRRVRKERETLFEEVQDPDGPEGERRGGPQDQDLLVVATQVVEAGIDFDFRTVATEICPIDSLIQRLGRCARRSGTKGLALVFKDEEQAEGVYPRDVIERTSEVLDEWQLAESVRNVGVATELVDKVYAKDVVERLRFEVSSYLQGALSFIKTFFPDQVYVEKSVLRKVALNLVKLGMELRCLLLPQELYQKVLACCEGGAKGKASIDRPLRECLELLTEHTLSLSVPMIGPRERMEIPSLKHRIGDKEYYLLLSLRTKEIRTEEELEVAEDASSRQERFATLEITMVDDLSKLLSRDVELVHPLIINPYYYEELDGYHLGLVKPYGKGQ